MKYVIDIIENVEEFGVSTPWGATVYQCDPEVTNNQVIAEGFGSTPAAAAGAAAAEWREVRPVPRHRSV